MSNRQRMEADERLIALIEHGAADVEAIDGVGAIEHHKPLVMPSRLFHGPRHRRHIRVEAGSDILDVEDEHVDVLELIRRRPT